MFKSNQINMKNLNKSKLFVLFAAATVVSVLFVVSVIVPQQTQAASLTSTCHLSSATPSGYENRVLVTFPGGIQNPSNFWMSSKVDDYRKTQEAVYRTIPSGTYRVTLEAFDNHSDHGGQNQTREQYYVALKDANGNIVVKTGASADIPNTSDYTVPPTIVNTALVIGAGVARFVPTHAAYPDNSNPNSVTAVCAAFDKIITGTPQLAIDKQAINVTQGGSKADIIAAQPDQTIEFVIKVTNTGNAAASSTLDAAALPVLATLITNSII